jgi:hypothetical protein
VVVELRGQLLARERELDSKECAIIAWEDSLAASECALGRARVECNAKCDRVEDVRQDYQARIHAFMVGCRRSFNIDRILEEHRILLSL